MKIYSILIEFSFVCANANKEKAKKLKWNLHYNEITPQKKVNYIWGSECENG